MNQDVQNFLNPKEFDCVSICSNISRQSNIGKMQRNQLKSQILKKGNKQEQVKELDNQIKTVFERKLQVQQKHKKEFNNFMTENTNTYQTTYSKDFNKHQPKHIRSRSDSRISTRQNSEDRKQRKEQLEQQIKESKQQLETIELEKKGEKRKSFRLKSKDKQQQQNRQEQEDQQVTWKDKQQSRQEEQEDQQVTWKDKQQSRQEEEEDQQVIKRDKQQRRLEREQEQMILEIMQQQKTHGRLDIDALLVDNIDYISHLFGYCKCNKCQCGIHKCDYDQKKKKEVKVRLKDSMRSSYQRDYLSSRKEDRLNNLPCCDQRTYNTRGPAHEAIDLQSTHRQEYSIKPLPIKTTPPTQPTKTSYSTGQSSYQANYIDYQQKQVYRPQVKKVTSVITSLPFQNTTSYKDNFFNFYNTQISSQKNRRNTFQQLKMTTQPPTVLPNYQSAEQQFITSNIQASPNLSTLQYVIPKRNKKQPYKPANVDQYQGTYTTTFGQDFQGVPENYCPGTVKTVPLNEIKSMILERIQERQYS